MDNGDHEFMAVYVDRAKNRYRHMKMSHMIADTIEELHEMADNIGLKRSWFQPGNNSLAHYDLCQSKRKLAIEYGAIEISSRELVAKIRKRRKEKNESNNSNNS